MKHVLGSASADHLARFARSEVLLAFDFDGTLAPIVDDPAAARMRDRTRELLERASRAYPCGVISGRGRDDVERRLDGVPVRYVVGNHGLEPSGDMARFEREVAAIRPQVQVALAGFPGVEVEDKRFSLSLHFRRARRKSDALEAIGRALAPFAGAIRAVPGKSVVSVVPAQAPHKGEALLRLRADAGAHDAIFVGDDVTDEDVFGIGQPERLLSIRVGRSRSSAASHYLRDQQEIDALLVRLLALRE
jgi:trehalose 6-phosphate phosphatase